MKKQLLIAAVAATMTSAAMADLSISGGYTAVFSDTGSVSDELDMKFVGKADAGSVTMTLNNVEDGVLDFDQVFLTSTVEGISVKAGAYKGQTGNSTTFKKGSAGSNKVKVSTKVAGLSIAHSNSDKTDISGSFAGVAVKMQNALNSSRTTSISTDISGVAVTAEKNDNTTAFTLSTEVSGMTVTYVNVDAATCTAAVTAAAASGDYAAATADSHNAAGDFVAGTAQVGTAAVAASAAVSCATQDDGLIGNIAGKHNVTGLNISANTAAGKVTLKAMQSDEGDVTKVSLKRGNVTYTYNDATDALSAKIKFKF